MYNKIIKELNQFLNFINIPATPLNPDAFQGIFIKKLSNQNIVRDKRKLSAGKNISTINQTHIDIPGKDGMLFFFEKLSNHTTPPQSIDIDIYDNNLKYLQHIDFPVTQTDSVGNIYFKRKTYNVPPLLVDWDLTLYSSAYKKFGHNGKQVQINIPNSEEAFTKLQKTAFQNDALIMLKYDYLRYVAILIPVELCNNLYSITQTHDTTNVNVVVPNPLYNPTLAYNLQYRIYSRNVDHDEINIELLQNSLIRNANAGTDIEKVVKTRVSQGAFRRLLLLERHQCNLCSISTTSVLRASHIKEWANSSREERIDANNGLLLCANHDALFDRHLISFNPITGQICISSSISPEQRAALNLYDSFILPMTDKMKIYMQTHYRQFLEKEKLLL